MNSEVRGSYVFENLEGRHTEARFLAERASLRLEGFPSLLARHEFPHEGSILEVGCGHGIRTRMMANLAPSAKVIGVDRSHELLTEARSQNSSANFQLGDLHELPFDDQSIDFIYARLVFMHLPDPRRALAELKRVLKRGGRLVIEDADRDCMFFEPAPTSFAQFWRLVQDGQRRLGGDSNIGRKLAPLLKSMGFGDVRIEAQPIIGDGQDIDFLVRTLLPSLNVYLEPAQRELGLRAIADLARLALDPSATFYHFWFAVSGQKSS